MSNYKRLFRSRKERVFGGICGGIGNFIGIDPVIIRLIWLGFSFIAGVGIAIYILSWIIIPLESKCNCEEPVKETTEPVKETTE